MSDTAQLAIVLAVAAGLFFWLGTFYAGGRRRASPSERVHRAAPDEAPLPARQERAAPTPESDSGPEGDTETDPDLGKVYAARPETADDLTQVRGIGKALSRQLNEVGIYTLEQIADWDRAQVAIFAERLALKDRIASDDWPGQARRLMR